MIPRCSLSSFGFAEETFQDSQLDIGANSKISIIPDNDTRTRFGTPAQFHFEPLFLTFKSNIRNSNRISKLSQKQHSPPIKNSLHQLSSGLISDTEDEMGDYGLQSCSPKKVSKQNICLRRGLNDCMKQGVLTSFFEGGIQEIISM